MVLASCTVLVGCSSSLARSFGIEQPLSATSFVDAIGFDSHFDYDNTPYVTKWTDISPLLQRSGIVHLRDGGNFSNIPYESRLHSLYERGIHHSEGFAMGVDAEKVAAVLKEHHDEIDFVEPANEYDASNKSDADWIASILKEQRIIFEATKRDSTFNRVVVLGPSLARRRSFGSFGSLDSIEDAANVHDYFTCGLNPGANGSGSISSVIDSARLDSKTKPIWVTETGYNDDPNRPCSMPDDVIAKYAPRSIAERILAGESRVYFYQLVDIPSDSTFGGMGFINADGVAKPQFTAITSLIALLRKSDAPRGILRPVMLSFDATTNDVHHLLLQKSAGTFDLLIWREVSAWRPNFLTNIGGVRTPQDAESVSVSFPKPEKVKIYCYDKDYYMSLASTFAKRTQISLNVSDSISVLELSSIHP